MCNTLGDDRPFVSTLIAQLCNHLAELPEELTELYKKYNNGTQVAALCSLQAALFAVAKKSDTIFIVADALDECPDDRNLRLDLLELIENMSTQSSSNVHLLVTSRSEQERKSDVFQAQARWPDRSEVTSNDGSVIIGSMT